MQAHAPEVVDISKETEETKALYGLDNERTEKFGRKCLLARRLVERGVRFVQIYSGGGHGDDTWDAHGDIVGNHGKHAGDTDKPIAGLLKDLKRRGLLDSTLVVWGGEFGRMPISQGGQGPRPQPRRTDGLDGGRRRQGRHGRRLLATRSATRRATTRTTSATCTPPSCTAWA